MIKRIVQLACMALIACTVIASPQMLSNAEAATAKCTQARWVASSFSSRLTVYVPTTSAGAQKCVRGSHGRPALNATKALQRSIQKCYPGDLGKFGIDGLYGFGIDGLYGKLTADGMRLIQSKEKVTVDGVYGPKTHNKMKFVLTLNPSTLCERVAAKV